MPTIAGVKALPWIAMIVLAVVAAVMFRFQVVEVNAPDGERTGTLDRWTGRVTMPTPTPTPTPSNRRPGTS